MQSHRRLSPRRKAAIVNGLKRSWQPGGTHYEKLKGRPADADTMRRRALEDRKGKPAATLFQGPVWDRVEYNLYHAKRRSDSYDVYVGTKLVCTGGRAKVGLFLGSILP